MLKVLPLAAVAWVAGAASMAHAADASQAEALDPVVGELVVTAQRRAQDAVEVPIALTALSTTRLEALRVRDLSDVAAFTPGLLVQDKSPIDARFVIRGIGSDDGSSYQEARVSVFQDGAPISRSRGAFVELFDLDRVEVSRGPQTTLYGRSALIGAVNLVQTKPSFASPDWRLLAEVSEFDGRVLEGAVNLPAGDTVAVRVAARYRTRDGSVDNLLGGPDFGGLETGAARVSLAFAPTERFRADLIFNTEKNEASGQSYKSRTFTPADPQTGAVLGDLDPAHGAALAAGPGFLGGAGLGADRTIDGVQALASWRIADGVTLNSISAARRLKSDQVLDYDGFAMPLLTVGDQVRSRQFSQELRLNVEALDRFTVVAGLSAYRETGSQRTPLQIDERLVLALLTGALDRRNPNLLPQAAYTNPVAVARQLQGLGLGLTGTALPAAQAAAIAGNLRGDYREEYSDRAENQALEVFGDLTWSASARWEVSAGLRYGWNDRRTELASALPEGRSVLAATLAAFRSAPAARAGLLAALARPGAATQAPSTTFPVPLLGLRAQPTTGNGDFIGSDLQDRGAAWRLAARYAVSDAVSLYATYARGRRPQVLSPNTPARPFGEVRFDRVAAETVDSVELGAKARLPQQGLSFDVAAYAYDYAHFQTVVQDGVQYRTADAGRARSYGLELQAAWRPTSAIELFGNYSYAHARFEEGLYKGNHLSLSPDHALTVGLDWRTPFAGGELQVLPTYRQVSRSYFTDDNGRPELRTGAFVQPLAFDASQPGFGLADLRISYRPALPRWTATIFAKNLFNTQSIREAGNGGQDFGLPTYIAGDPRTVGVSISLQR